MFRKRSASPSNVTQIGETSLERANNREPHSIRGERVPLRVRNKEYGLGAVAVRQCNLKVEI